MKQTPPNGIAEQHVREIRRQTRKKCSSEKKIQIVISGLRGELSTARPNRWIAPLPRSAVFLGSLALSGSPKAADAR
jgi:hypothetical protein